MLVPAKFTPLMSLVGKVGALSSSLPRSAPIQGTKNSYLKFQNVGIPVKNETE